MARILLQTTVEKDSGNDGCKAAGFSLLAALLANDGHRVVCRDREAQSDGSDALLPRLAESDFDELWLIAADGGDGLAPADVRGILRFRDRGGGILTARDQQNTGLSLLNLGSIGAVNNFQKYNRDRQRRTARYVSGNEGEYQRIVPMQPVHDVLRTSKTPAGVIEYFPAHAHEGAISVPCETPYARVIATALCAESGRTFNLAIAIDGEPSGNGHAYGRAVAISTFHQLSDRNWQLGDRNKLDIYKDYVLNLARWLAPER